MRVYHIAPVYPPYKGGMGKVAEQYVSLLKKNGIEAIPLTPIHARPLVKYGNGALMPSLLWRVRDADILHLHYPFYGGAIFTYFASRIWGIPLIVTYHMKTQGKGLLGSIFGLQRLFIEPMILRQATSILVSSFDYAKACGLSYPQIKELPFGIKIKTASVQKKTSHPATIIFVGGLDKAHYFKGLEILLRALSQVSPTTPWRLLIVGDGSERAKFEELARERKMEKSVVFLGGISDEELASAYQESSLHILPSIDRSEAYGLVTLEAGLHGIPSIATNLPGVRTLVEQNETGLIVEPNNVRALQTAIEQFLQNKERFAKMGEQARLRICQNYDENTLIGRLIDLYREL